MNSSMANLSLFLSLLSLSCLVSTSYSYQFVLNWVAKPSENYNQWAERMRFQVNDTILFKYKSGSDSVAVVSKDDYDKCNAANPMIKFDGGDSIFEFNRSGPFYFISGNKASCDQGQKMIVVVLAVRSPPSFSPPSPEAPSPTAAAPVGSSPTSSPAGGPSGAVSPGPAASSLPPSPAGGAPPPATSPAEGPGGGLPETPSSSVTPGAPGSSTPGSGSGSGSGSPDSTPGSGSAADANTPPGTPRSLAAPPCRGCGFLISTASLLVSAVALGVFV